MQTSTHRVTIGEAEVRKEFVADHEALAEQEWACLTLLAEHAPADPLAGAGARHRAPPAVRRPGRGRACRRDRPTQVRRRRDGAGAGRAAAPDRDLAECRDPVLVGESVALARAFVADPPLPAPRQTALGIADLNPANVMWDGSVVRLVDFEDGGLSEPAYELADHVEHLGSCAPGVYDARVLAAAVGLDADDVQRMQAYRPLFAAFWLAMLLPGSTSWARNPPGTTEATAEHFMALAGAH